MEVETAKILVVDDDPDVRMVLKTGLESEGWSVLEAEDSRTMFDLIDRNDIDLVTLDLMLGNEDGLALARAIRTRRDVPIFMLTARATPRDRVDGLESGADDYILKPFHIREVVLRIRKALELYGRVIPDQTKVFFDHTQFEPQRGIVRNSDGTLVDLTGLELRLLELFVRNPGKVLSRDDISQALRGRDWSPEDRTIDGHIARLRRKIGSAEALIRTVRGVGYVFAGDVTLSDPEQGDDHRQ